MLRNIKFLRDFVIFYLIYFDRVFIAIGHSPNSSFEKDFIKIDGDGYIPNSSFVKDFIKIDGDGYIITEVSTHKCTRKLLQWTYKKNRQPYCSWQPLYGCLRS